MGVRVWRGLVEDVSGIGSEVERPFVEHNIILYFMNSIIGKVC